MKERTCTEMIDEMFEDRIKDVKAELKKQKNDDYDGDNNELANNVLYLDTHITVYMLLSTGGPEDGYEFDIDTAAKEISGGRYVYKGWGDCAKRELADDELLDVLAAYNIVYESYMSM